MNVSHSIGKLSLAEKVMRAEQEAYRCLLCHDAPCSQHCPAETDPGRFIRAVRFRNLTGAAEIIRNNNPLGAVCARVCPTEKLCQCGCSRAGLDRPVDIGLIQEMLTDYEQVKGLNFCPPVLQDKAPVAIVGAGPAGLSAARTLALGGHPVVVYEAQAYAGGWARYGIPDERLPRQVVEREIAQIAQCGVEFRYGIRVGSNVTLEELRASYSAVLVAAGLWCPIRTLNNDSQQVQAGIDFLFRVNQGEIQSLDGMRVLVIGGGDVAADCAYEAKRLGAQVSILYRRNIDEMPATTAEKQIIASLGIPVIPNMIVTHLVELDGQLMMVKGIFIEWSSRYQYEVLANAELTLPCDLLIEATGQQAGFAISAEPTQGLFVSGDLAKSGGTVVEAVGHGVQTAKQIMSYLAGKSIESTVSEDV